MLFIPILLLFFLINPNLHAVSSVTPPQGIAPILYIMNDRSGLRETWQSQLDGAGALGGWFNLDWKLVEPSQNRYSFETIEGILNSESNKITTLKNGQRIKKPIALSIMVYPGIISQASLASVPEYAFAGGVPIKPRYQGRNCDDPYFYEKQGNCSATLLVPPWNSTTFIQGYDNMLRAFGERYDSDPRINSVWITSGIYGENKMEWPSDCLVKANASDSQHRCMYDITNSGSFFFWYIDTSSASNIGIIKKYRQFFPTKPLLVINSAPTARRDTTIDALSVSPPIGIKHNALDFDLPNANCDENAPWVTILDYWKTTQRAGQAGLLGYEHFFAHDFDHSYWAILTATSRHTTLMDLPISDSSDPRDQTRHLITFARMQKQYETALASNQINRNNSADFFPIWKFTEDHFGRDATNTPDVWIVLRDTNFKETYRYGRIGEPGDYEYYLYRPEANLNYVASVGRTFGFGGNGQARDIDNVNRTQAKTVVVPAHQLPGPAKTQMIGSIYKVDPSNPTHYDSFFRRTDQATQNRYMYFQIDPNWPALLTTGFDIEVTYLDQGTDKLKIQYGPNASLEIGITKQNTGKFIREIVELPNHRFNSENKINQFGDHFRLDCNMDGDETIHMIRVIPRNWQAPLWNFGPLAAGGTPYPTATRAPTSTPNPYAPTSTPTGIQPTQTPIAPIPTTPVEPGSCSGCYGLLLTCQRGCASPKTCVIPPDSAATCGWDAYRCCAARAPFAPPTEGPPRTSVTPTPPSPSIPVNPATCTGCYGYPQTCVRGCPLTSVCVIPPGSAAACGWEAYRCCRRLNPTSTPTSPLSTPTPTSPLPTPTSTPSLPPPVDPTSCAGCYGYPQTCLRTCSSPSICVIPPGSATTCGWEAYRCCRPLATSPTPICTYGTPIVGTSQVIDNTTKTVRLRVVNYNDNCYPEDVQIWVYSGNTCTENAADVIIPTDQRVTRNALTAKGAIFTQEVVLSNGVFSWHARASNKREWGSWSRCRTFTFSPALSPSPAPQFQCHCSRTPDLKPQGDANCDGTINQNQTDFGIWSSEFLNFSLGQYQALWRADFNCDRKIDISDFNIWKNN